MLNQLRDDIKKIASSEKAKASQWFFKTGPGEYGEGDQFIGIKVPEQRILAKKYKDLPFDDVVELLKSPIHEERLISLFIMIHQFKKGDEALKKRYYDIYMSHTDFINNWDLIDSSAGYIPGEYLKDKPKDILFAFARSESLWKRRIAIMSTFPYIKKGNFSLTYELAEILLHDKHDLIHKAVGWMLREVGGVSGIAVEESFLKKHYKQMPRTMLRYAIEKFPEAMRRKYLNGEI
jgi:3-methyladenine DNA glycosylase AlkD